MEYDILLIVNPIVHQVVLMLQPKKPIFCDFKNINFSALEKKIVWHSLELNESVGTIKACQLGLNEKKPNQKIGNKFMKTRFGCPGLMAHALERPSVGTA